MFTITVTFTVKNEDVDRFRTLILNQAQDSLTKELACRVFDVAIGESKEGIVPFFLYELYDTESDFKAHLNSTHFIDFNKVSAPYVVSKVVDAWERISS
ncbi:putative quinol monooxygenase [Marinomonas sp. 2405UD68-3]|uniref:putative quinol monooxygenase n=1 Tax=Marinomonas sp. 2405UD68-3 TaxID=3391835 RepID=UPI0039C9319A